MLIPARRTIYTGSIGKVVATYAPLEAAARPSIFTKDGVYERFFRLKNLVRNSLRFKSACPSGAFVNPF